MTSVALFKQDGTQNGDVTLNDAVFGVEPNENVVFDAILMQRASMRQGTHAVKNRSARRGGGRKPWRQKGTGRARKGGIVFGPTPRSYSYKLPKKVMRLALKSVLSQKVLDNSLVAVDSLAFDAPKTKDFVNVLNNLNVDTKTLVLVEEDNEKAALAGRNLPNVKILKAKGVNVLDVANSDKLVVTQKALDQLEEALA